MPRRRLGVVILLPPPTADEVQGLRRACADSMLERVAPHLTLVPPVNVREDDLATAMAVLRGAAAAAPPVLELTLGPVTSFLPVNPVLYLDVAGDVAHVHALRQAGVAPPFARDMDHLFVPHVTLATEMTEDRIAHAEAALADYAAVVRVDRVHVLEEQRDEVSGERVWQPIADVALGPPAVIGRGGLELELTASGMVDEEAEVVVGPAWLAADLEDFGEVSSGGREPLVVTARREGAVVGVVEGWTTAGIGFVDGLIVVPSARRRGVARQLLGRFESMAVERGCRSLGLRTLADGGARSTYEALGWRVESELPDWMYGRDFVQMRRWL